MVSMADTTNPECKALTELQAILSRRVARGLAGEASAKTFDEIVSDEMLQGPTIRAAVEKSALKNLAASTAMQPFQAEEADHFVRRMRDSDRY